MDKNDRSGVGSFEDADGTKYEGTFDQSKFHGYGTCIWTDGSKYIGEWL
jgi:hypothetical protein